MPLLSAAGTPALLTEAPTRRPPPLVKKGARAWEHAGDHLAGGRSHGGVNRLHVHAVDDGTNFAYVKEVRPFLQAVKSERLPFNAMGARDQALADYLSDLCYVHQKGVSKGTFLVLGFLAIFPEHKGHIYT